MALLAFAALAVSVQAGWTQALDVRLLLAIGESRPLWATRIMRVASVLGSGAVEVPLGLLISLQLAKIRRRREAGGYAAAVLSGWALYALAKLAFRRARPHVISRLMHGAGWYAFPSGHAMLAPLVFGLGALIWAAPWPRRRRAALLAAAVLSLLIAYSRVYLGMHWPTDAVGGLLLGTGWAGLWMWWWERSARARGQIGRDIEKVELTAR
ncbi:MAG: phosphatase PAP2 family protein [Gemmatimonadota bacterium]|nr:phosphatase PAP2 family protein [Gemmatimonadota bacterium]